MPLFLLFVVVPIVEIWLFLTVGGRIGVLNTILVVILTAAAGAFLVRQQGMAALKRAQLAMGQGQVPGNELMDGVMILAAGLLMLTPGFFTDTVGFLLLIPATRAILRQTLLASFKKQITNLNEPPPVRASRIEIIDDSDDSGEGTP